MNEGAFNTMVNTSQDGEGLSLERDFENIAIITGKVCGQPEFSHSIFGESFYGFQIEVPRLSQYSDILPVTASEKLMNDEIQVGSTIRIYGQIRSYNKVIDGANRLVLTIFARDIVVDPEEDDENPNQIILTGCICKPPIYRMTPFEREIADILLAVNRAYNKSDYIPCIAWGRNARFARSLAVGQAIRVIGRMQSREYEKQLPNGEKVKKVAYEVSITAIEKRGQTTAK